MNGDTSGVLLMANESRVPTSEIRQLILPVVEGPLRVLFLCTGNSCRSQIAEALLKANGPSTVAVVSAGTRPSAVSPDAIRVMAEIGVDISAQQSKSMDQFSGHTFDYVITLCGDASERCPAFPGNPLRLHWPLPDPAAIQGTDAERLRKFREVRDDIAVRVEDLLSEILDGFLRELHHAWLARGA